MGKKNSDFFDRMPCIVDMRNMFSDHTIYETDSIVRVVLSKDTYPRYTVYFYRHIYNDDRKYKCKDTFYALPEVALKWIQGRELKEKPIYKYWE